MTAIAVHSSSDAFRFGTQSLLVTTGDSGDNAIYPDGDIAVVAGTAYTFSAYIFTPTPLAGGGVKIVLCPAGSLVPFAESDIVADTSDAPDGWHRLILTGTVPGGIFSVRPAIVYTGTTAGQQFFLDGVKCEPGAVASEWEANIVSPGTVLDQKGMVIDATQASVFRLAGSGGGARDQVTLGVHGLLFGGDTEVSSPGTGIIDINGNPLVSLSSATPAPTDSTAATGGTASDASRSDHRHLGHNQSHNHSAAADGNVLNPSSLKVGSTDVVLSRPAAKTLQLDADGAGGALTEVIVKGPLRHANQYAEVQVGSTNTLTLTSSGTWYKVAYPASFVPAYAGQVFLCLMNFTVQVNSTLQTILAALRVDNDTAGTINGYVQVIQNYFAGSAQYAPFLASGIFVAAAGDVGNTRYLYAYFLNITSASKVLTFYNGAAYASNVRVVALP